jgi:hypothetical protein
VRINTQFPLSVFRRYGSVALCLITLLVLLLHPVPLCFDCEFPDAWGHHDDRWDMLILTWCLLAPFLAGLLVRRFAWLVPTTTVLAFLMTQHLGGVPAWSIINNEGPFIAVLGSLAALLYFEVGRLLCTIAISIVSIVASRAT